MANNVQKLYRHVYQHINEKWRELGYSQRNKKIPITFSTDLIYTMYLCFRRPSISYHVQYGTSALLRQGTSYFNRDIAVSSIMVNLDLKFLECLFTIIIILFC